MRKILIHRILHKLIFNLTPEELSVLTAKLEFYIIDNELESLSEVLDGDQISETD